MLVQQCSGKWVGAEGFGQFADQCSTVANRSRWPRGQAAGLRGQRQMGLPSSTVTQQEQIFIARERN
jgi:hypothetical protein